MIQLATVNKWNIYGAGLVALVIVALVAILQLCRFLFREKALMAARYAEVSS